MRVRMTPRSTAGTKSLRMKEQSLPTTTLQEDGAEAEVKGVVAQARTEVVVKEEVTKVKPGEAGVKVPPEVMALQSILVMEPLVMQTCLHLSRASATGPSGSQPFSVWIRGPAPGKIFGHPNQINLH